MAQNRRFQQGSLFKRGTRTKMWVARWWEDVIGPDGKSERVRRSEVLGTVAELPTSREAKQKLSARLRAVNSGDYRTQSTWTLKGFIQDRWLPDVLPTIRVVPSFAGDGTPASRTFFKTLWLSLVPLASVRILLGVNGKPQLNQPAILRFRGERVGERGRVFDARLVQRTLNLLISISSTTHPISARRWGRN